MLYRNSLLLILAAVLSFYFYYFKKTSKPASEKGKNIIAMVDQYDITLDDFIREKEKLLPFLDASDKVDKKHILELLTDNLILLAEGERLKLTHRESFLKKIEYYWRQNIIMELLAEKTAGIQQQIRITEEETRKFYDSMQNEYYFRYMELPDNNVGDFDSFIREHPEKIRYDSGFQWVGIRTISPQFRSLLSRDTIQFKKWALHQHKNRFYLTYFETTRPILTGAFEDVKQEIETYIREQKEQQMLEAWMVSLRKAAKITINQDLYSKL